MIGLVISLALILLITTAALLAVDAGMRAGDRDGDVRVSAVTGVATQAGRYLPVVVATVCNPGATPVLVGLSVRRRRMPAWLEAGMEVRVPRHTARKRLRAGRHTVLGVLGSGETARWPVPVPPGTRRCRLVAVVGQAGGRLRVLSLPVASGPPGSPVAGPDPVPQRER